MINFIIIIFVQVSFCQADDNINNDTVGVGYNHSDTGIFDNRILTDTLIGHDTLKTETKKIDKSDSLDIYGVFSEYDDLLKLFLLIIILFVLIAFSGYSYIEIKILKEDYNKLLDHFNQSNRQYNHKIEEIVKFVNALRTTKKNNKDNFNSNDNANNHMVHIKLADSVHKMKNQIRILKAKKETKEVKLLERILQEQEETLQKNGYEIIDLNGDRYLAELKHLRVVHTLKSDELNPGERLITKMIKPQVRYKSNIIREGHIEVTESISKK